MKYLALILLLTSGCATVDRAVCYGAGTCMATSTHYDRATAQRSSLPQTVILPSGTYVIVPNYSTGSVSAVIKTSKGK